MQLLKLTDDLLIAKGGERACYIHPTDPTKVIKIVFIEGSHNHQNELEYTYFKYLEKKQVSFAHISRSCGYIETNLGRGLAFERIINYDGSASLSLRYVMVHHLISEELQHELLKELRIYLQNNTILFVDTSLTNIFCQEYEKDKYKLVIIDGLGAKRLGFKAWLYRHSKLYTRYKIARQWTKFMKMYRKDISRIHEGKRPITRF